VLDENKVLMPIFAGFGEWMLSIFELDVFGSATAQENIPPTTSSLDAPVQSPVSSQQ